MRGIFNVDVKMDMIKEYDRVSWILSTKVIRRFCFSEMIFDMRFRIMSNNWYSILIMVGNMVLSDFRED